MESLSELNWAKDGIEQDGTEREQSIFFFGVSNLRKAISGSAGVIKSCL